jgi:hypothetical protein
MKKLKKQKYCTPIANKTGKTGKKLGGNKTRLLETSTINSGIHKLGGNKPPINMSAKKMASTATLQRVEHK